MIIAGTGHRPDKLGGYSDEAFQVLVDILVEFLIVIKPRTVISGLALGFDQALAQAVIHINEQKLLPHQIKLIGAAPFKSQDSNWPQSSKTYYQELLKKCDKVIIVSEGDYSVAKMMKRNKWMVDNANVIVTIFDGTSGGTKNTVDYAESKKKQVINLYQKFLEKSC